MNAARVRELAWLAKLASIVPALQIGRRIDSLEQDLRQALPVILLLCVRANFLLNHLQTLKFRVLQSYELLA